MRFIGMDTAGIAFAFVQTREESFFLPRQTICSEKAHFCF